MKNNIDYNTNYGKVYNSNGFAKDVDSLYGIKNIESIIGIPNGKKLDDINDNKYAYLHINHMLKNLGDVGMALYASVNKINFKTTDKISRTYFIIFNFYKFLRNVVGLNIKYLPHHLNIDSNIDSIIKFGQLLVVN